MPTYTDLDIILHRWDEKSYATDFGFTQLDHKVGRRSFGVAIQLLARRN